MILLYRGALEDDAAWHAAYEYTVAREEAIRLVREEIEELWANAVDFSTDCYQRIFARLQVALNELLRGWKGEQ
jgi:hypothetical protein